PPKKYRHLFRIRVLLATITQAIGMDTLFNYAPIIYEKAGFKTATSAIAATGLTNLVQVIASGLIYFYINEAQRKNFMARGLIFLGILLVLLALSFWFLAGTSIHPWIVLILLLFLTGAYNFAFISVAWVAIAEIFHDSVRAEGLAIATLVSYLFSVLLSQTYLNLWNILGAGGVFFMFALICFASVYFVVRWLVETKELHITD
ncbi:MAG: MFS transporter, partial [bacterium]|nr:MFS transporter [bacterium]